MVMFLRIIYLIVLGSTCVHLYNYWINNIVPQQFWISIWGIVCFLNYSISFFKIGKAYEEK